MMCGLQMTEEIRTQELTWIAQQSALNFGITRTFENNFRKKNTFNFSCRFHEMGFYDIPAMTSFILKETGQPQLSYVGHSMGTTMFFAFCSTRPELQSRIRQMHALAPVAFMSRLKSPIRKVAPFARLLQVRRSNFLQISATNLFL
jgi:pimeloyl-ACP methyl ester carboxylesterase